MDKTRYSVEVNYGCAKGSSNQDTKKMDAAREEITRYLEKNKIKYRFYFTCNGKNMNIEIFNDNRDDYFIKLIKEKGNKFLTYKQTSNKLFITEENSLLSFNILSPVTISSDCVFLNAENFMVFILNNYKENSADIEKNRISDSIIALIDDKSKYYLSMISIKSMKIKSVNYIDGKFSINFSSLTTEEKKNLGILMNYVNNNILNKNGLGTIEVSKYNGGKKNEEKAN